MIPGGFEERARMREVRDRLWRAVWVQAHAYDDWHRLLPPRNRRGGVAESIRCPALKVASDLGDAAFENACEDQRIAVKTAERLGFNGRRAWIEDAARAERKGGGE